MRKLEFYLSWVMVALMTVADAIIWRTFDWTIVMAVTFFGLATIIASVLVTLTVIVELGERKAQDARAAAFRAGHEPQSIPVPRACESATEFASRISPSRHPEEGWTVVEFIGPLIILILIALTIFKACTPPWKPLPGHEPTYPVSAIDSFDCIAGQLIHFSGGRMEVVRDSAGHVVKCTAL